MIFLKSQSQQAAKKVNFTMDGLVGELTEAELEMVVGGMQEGNDGRIPFVRCDSNENDCREGETCHKLMSGVGACVPQKADANDACPAVGSTSSGLVNGYANEDGT